MIYLSLLWLLTENSVNDLLDTIEPFIQKLEINIVKKRIWKNINNKIWVCSIIKTIKNYKFLDFRKIKQKFTYFSIIIKTIIIFEKNIDE